ncbi:MAG: T9SS type A sorting domain-containing protein [Ignavibacteria bacterium]|nr:T9SS type A sorting domain-containing protein [Ignavibacteria bacterium]
MKNIVLLLFLLILLFTINTFGQTPKSEVYEKPIPYIGNSADWGNDLLVSPTEPFGRFSSVYRLTNTTVYIAIPDTNIVSGKCVVVLKSSNNGLNWVIHGSVSPAAVIPKVKMLRSADSVYCFFLFGTSVYCWNVLSNSLNQFTAYTNLRDFDVTISSTGSLYLIIDLHTSNQVYIYGSNTGGFSWGSSIYLSSAAAHPKIAMSGSGDTALINYYGPVAADTLTSAIRNVRYRETSPGTLAITGSFTTPIAAGTVKDQFQGVINMGRAWIFYTTGTTGNIDLNCVASTDNGTNYGSPVTIHPLPGRDEYWFDVKYYNVAGGGIDVIYYSDSLQSGPPTALSDILFFTSATNSSPTSFITPVRVSNYPIEWSARMYIPTLVEYYDAIGDAGAFYVGIDASQKKVFYDRLGNVTRVSKNETSIPESFILEQNYPNPFNPLTTIEFSIPENTFVAIKVYDISGREVSTLVNENLQSGRYTVSFDGSNLSSGIYFYKLITNKFTATRKMILVK